MSRVRQETIVEDRSVGPTGSPILRKYARGKLLGKGGFAKVFEMREIGTDKVLAGKIVGKESLGKSRSKAKLVEEIRIHRALSHPNIVKFDRFFDDKEYVYMLLEVCRNQTMMELIKRRGRLTEHETQKYMTQIIDAVKYLHAQKIIHRDLKVGNLFLGSDMEIKVGDFGLATKLEYQGERKRTVCGTPNYIAPEILESKDGYSFEVDIWSIGVVMYTMLVGRPPFETADVKTTYKRIKANQYEFPEHLHISECAKDIVRNILQTQPESRPSLDGILAHEFFSSARAIKVDSEPSQRLESLIRTMSSTSSTYRPALREIQTTAVAVSEPLKVAADLEKQPLELAAEPKVSPTMIRKDIYSSTRAAVASMIREKELFTRSSNKENVHADKENVLSAKGSEGSLKSKLVSPPLKSSTSPPLYQRFSSAYASDSNITSNVKSTLPIRQKEVSTRDVTFAAPAKETTVIKSVLSVKISDIVSKDVAPASVSPPSTSPTTPPPLVDAQEVDDDMDEEERSRLCELHDQVEESFANARKSLPTSEPVTSPPAPVGSPVWVTKWVDYSSKYGLGYRLSNNSVGVFFNDATKIILSPDGSSVDYIDRRKSSGDSGEERRTFTLSDYPKDLQKKVTLLKHFRGYLGESSSAQTETTTGTASASGSDVPFVKKWLRTRHAIIFRLSTKTIQVNFYDKTEMLLCGEQRTVSYLNKKSERECYSLSSVPNSPELLKRLKYTKDILHQLISRSPTIQSEVL